jgi:hypothetical protein
MSGRLTMPEFRARMAAHLRASLPDVTVTAGDEEDTLRLALGAPALGAEMWTIWLGNAYGNYLDQPDDLEGVLARMAAALAAIRAPETAMAADDSWGDAVGRLKVQLVGAGIEQRAGIPAGTLLLRPWQCGLAVSAVMDFPGHLQRLTRSDQLRWGVADDQIFAAGAAGLRAHAATLEPRTVAIPEFGFSAKALIGDLFAASLALVPEVIRGWWPDGEPVLLAIPNQDVLVTVAMPDGLDEDARQTAPLLAALLIQHVEGRAYPLLGGARFQVFRLAGDTVEPVQF